ncbi:MAG TPA: MarR family transcriptional regulator [Holophaga sp.]|nr:MarR family transcriptional regulator [Holophaga sp.]
MTRRHPRIDLPEGTGEGGVLLAQAHQLGGRFFARLLRERGIEELNPAQGRIVYALWREDGLTQAELGSRTKLDKSTLTLMLARLEAAGQVRRCADPADARLRRVFLTEGNRKLHATYRDVSEEMLTHFYRDLTVDEITDFERTLRRIIKNLEERGR